jgi:hypothetical protein
LSAGFGTIGSTRRPSTAFLFWFCGVGWRTGLLWAIEEPDKKNEYDDHPNRDGCVDPWISRINDYIDEISQLDLYMSNKIFETHKK